MRKAKRLLVRLGVTMGLVVGTLAVTGGPASAYAYVCSWSHGAGGSTCMLVSGSSNWVDALVVEHDDGVNWGNFCNYYAQVRYRTSYGVNVTQWTPYRPNCVAIRASVRTSVNTHLYNPSYVYGMFFHDGSWAPGEPRATVSA